MTVSLDKAECWVEFKIRFEVSRIEKLNLHRILTSVVKHYLFPVELVVNQYV